jgi:uncharacterized protein
VTTVWVVVDGDRLLVTTPIGSGKVKRLHRDPRVVLQPSGRRGAVEPGAPTLTGTAVDLGEAGNDQLIGRFRAKYGWEFRLFMLIEKVVTRAHRRTMFAITPD